MTRAFTMATVNFQAKASETQLAELQMRSEAAGVPWHEAVQVLKGQLNESCRVAAARALQEILNHWSVEEWQAGKQRFV